ncbi:protein-export membrane protein SecD [Candidatus Woesebacteria bacterium RIFCSPHIGHO2_01_FULL_38_9]|uniref:Protein translocase subunit SecD n=2 Tax=Candidatus Woeseibacteriota TaxID=1752722 RepID=A0A1F7XZJ5_9BACT|nr:MAG: protein-export membrane protein SecD [Candidatus Woesebacteria bacterium RIFCSPHIGHO2_01_FULL_38_9]OGM58893.1 MAG: protein-export membrane protein SecD [Candidatus Woesebacteria bacterium RIFCSPLOWO2_01_FULL_39_10]
MDKTFTRPGLDISTSRFSINKDFELILGLDLAGGSHLVFEAKVGSLPDAERKSALESLRNVIERRVNLFGISEPNVQSSSFEGKNRIIVELPGVKDTKEAVNLIGQTAQLVFVEIGTGEEPSFGVQTDLTGADLKKATVIFDKNTGKPVVQLEFIQEGAEKFANITERNVGKPLPIYLDNVPISTPVVQEKITGGSAIISGDFTLNEAKNLTVQLNAGALPVPIELVEQRTVGATLGAESVEKSITAGLVGLLMVLIFMVFAYGKLGMVADLALIIFGILTLALYKLIPVVLTLPGIAGFLLSVGMAVDSNILIFERLKEEWKKRNFADALEVSFGRAWDSIRDANIATLVTAFVLANPLDFPFLHTSGPVRGFAITLSLGIAISLFTGLVVSRNLLRVFVKEKKND